MKKNVIALLCTAVLAAVIAVPFGLAGTSAPADALLGEAVVEGDAVGASDGAGRSEMQSEDVGAASGDAPFGGADFETGVALVSFKPANSENLDESLEQLRSDTGINGLEISHVGSGYVELAFPADIATDEAISRIGMSDVIDSVQPNFLYYVADEDAADGSITPVASIDLQSGAIELNAQGLPNDYNASSMWHLSSTSGGVDAVGAWDYLEYTSGGETADSGDVTVAVLDNCFNVSHNDLKNNVVAEKSVTDAGISSQLSSNTNHGTHVAGIVAAQANNGIGAVGVSYNAKVMPVRVSNTSGGISTSNLVDAYTYVLGKASEYNVRVINVSIGGGRSTLTWSALDRQLFAKIDEAYARNIVTVTAACNTSSSSSITEKAPFYVFPGDYPKCVTVINVDKNGNRASTSNYNKTFTRGGMSYVQMTKDISAPGQLIYSTYLNGSYGTMSGTSMAAPVVSGVLAMMFAHEPSLTADSAVSRLYSTATDLNTDGWDAETGYGRVNANNAVTGSVSVTGTASMKVGGTTTLSFSKSSTQTLTGWSSSDTSVATVENGVVTGVSAGSAVITATYAEGRLSKSAAQTVTVYDPTILSGGSVVTDLGLRCDETAQLSVTNDQPAGNWRWSSSNSAVASVNNTTGVVTGVNLGSAVITVTLDDNPAISASLQVEVTSTDISEASVSLSQTRYTYDGSAKRPDVVSVKVGSTVLGTSDYMVTYSNNVNASSEAKVTISGLGKYSNSCVKYFTIEEAPLGSVTLSPSSFVYDGYPKVPSVTVTSQSGATLTQGTDYTVAYSDNVNVGSRAAVHVAGRGNYTGTAVEYFSIADPSSAPAPTPSSDDVTPSGDASADSPSDGVSHLSADVQWTRIWGDIALDTMQKIVEAGNWQRGGTVVLATVSSYHDALIANGVAGMADAPIVMTDGQSLSSQTRNVLASLAPATIVVCGGTEAISDDVAEAACDAAGTGPALRRLWGAKADTTAVAIYQGAPEAVGGQWEQTAFVCTDAGYWDALSAAPVSYKRHMPIFLAQGGESLSDATMAAMREGGVTNVYIVGGEEAVSPSVATQLEGAGIAVSDRLWGADAVATSSKVAAFGLSQGLSADGMGIATTHGYWDALAGSAFCGRMGSVIVLVNGPQASSIADTVEANVSSLSHGYVFGGTSAVSNATLDALPH